MRCGGIQERRPGFTRTIARAGSVALLDPANGGSDRSPARWNVRVGLLGGEPESRDLQSQIAGKQGAAAQVRQIKIKNKNVTAIFHLCHKKIFLKAYPIS